MHKWLVAPLLVTLAACEAVPDLRFSAPSEAGVVEVGKDGSAEVPDAGADVAVDAGPIDAGVLLCTEAAPSSAAVCCGKVWCDGSCGVLNCDACARAGCKATETCCAKPGTVQCKPKCP